MTPQELKNSILQLAIQGKLVEQRPEEGTAEALTNALMAKKKEWAASGKILKKADTKPFYTVDELSEFDIPESWSWVQLADVSIIQEGAGIRKWQYRDSGTQILCVTNILEGAIDLEKKQLYISTEEYMEKYQHLTPCKGDIVTSCSGGSWGKTAIFDCEETMMLNTSTLRLRFFDDLADNSYLYYLTKCTFFKRQLERQLSGMQPNFGYAHYSRIMLPLPPLAEQKRIVAKIEELLPYIDRYDQAWSKLEELNKRFPIELQKSILQMAIQGKLVEQHPEEGTGGELYQQLKNEKQKQIKAGRISKSKSLTSISEDDYLFDIPESWIWIKIGDIAAVVTKGTTPIGGNVSYLDSGIGFLRAENVAGYDKLDKSTLKYIDEKTHTDHLRRSILQCNDILVTIAGTLGRTAIVREEDLPLNTNQAVSFVRIVSPESINLLYLIYALNSPEIQKYLTGQRKITAIPNLTLEIIENCVLPLPPRAEQNRIVAKLQKVLPLCEKLKK